MQNIRNEHILQLNNKIQKQRLNKSIKLGSINRQKKCNLTPASKITLANSQQILSSVSKKLQPQNIQTANRFNDSQSSMIQKRTINLTCMVDFDSVSLMSFISDRFQITFSDMKKKIKQQTKQKLIVDIHQNKKDRKGCFQINCNIKKKWIRNIVFYQRQLKNLLILKQKLPFINKDVLQQINKDIYRSFPQNMFPKKKLTVYHASSQKVCLFQTLKIVLKLYSIFDQQISYIQGINLIAVTIIIHMKQIQSSFIFLKQLMYYGKLRLFYLNDFEMLKKQSINFYQNYLKNTIYQLYEHFNNCNIQPLMIVPGYYACLFSSIVDVNYMHIIIDQFFIHGIIFLHKLYLSLLLFMKSDLLQSGEQTLYKLGITHLKTLTIPWEQIILVAEIFKNF